MIVVGHLTGASIAALFFGGIAPGLLVGGALMAAGYRRARVWERERTAGARDAASPDADSPDADSRGADAPDNDSPDAVSSPLREFAAALPMLLMPVLVLGGILAGAFTATEAAGVAVAYLVVVGFLGRNLRLRDFGRALVDSALRSAVVLFVATTAALFRLDPGGGAGGGFDRRGPRRGRHAAGLPHRREPRVHRSPAC